MTLADTLCDRVAFLLDGRIAAVGAPRELKLEHARRTVRVELRRGDALEALGDPWSRGDPESPLRWKSKSTRKLAAAGLIIIMIGAIYFHIAYAIPSALPATVLLILCALTIYWKWDRSASA